MELYERHPLQSFHLLLPELPSCHRKAVGQISDKIQEHKENIEAESLNDIYRMDNFRLKKGDETVSRVHTHAIRQKVGKAKQRDEVKQRLRADSRGSEFSDEEWIEGGKRQKFEVMESPPLLALVENAIDADCPLRNLEVLSLQVRCPSCSPMCVLEGSPTPAHPSC